MYNPLQYLQFNDSRTRLLDAVLIVVKTQRWIVVDALRGSPPTSDKPQAGHPTDYRPFPPHFHFRPPSIRIFSKSRSITHSDPHHPDPNPNPHSFASTASPFPRISASDCRDSRECCCLATVFDIACSVLAPRLTRESFAPRGSLILDPAICVLPISDDDAGVIVRRVRAWSIFVRRKAVAWWWCMVDGDVPRGIVLSHSRKVNA